jgi:hypothetical protein
MFDVQPYSAGEGQVPQEKPIITPANPITGDLTQKILSPTMNVKTAYDRIFHRLTSLQIDEEGGIDEDTGQYQLSAELIDIFEQLQKIWREFYPSGRDFLEEEIREVTQKFLLWSVSLGIREHSGRISISVFKKWFFDELYPYVLNIGRENGVAPPIPGERREAITWGDDSSAGSKDDLDSEESEGPVRFTVEGSVRSNRPAPSELLRSQADNVSTYLSGYDEELQSIQDIETVVASLGYRNL